MLSWRCHFENFVGLFRRPFWSRWANFLKKGSKRVPFRHPFWRLWGHFGEKCLKMGVCCKVKKKGIGKVKTPTLWGCVFGVLFYKKHVKRVTRNRFWNRNTFYWILGVPVIEKKASGRCRMSDLHSNNRVEWRSAFFSRNLEIDGPRHGKSTFGSHFGRPGDTQTWTKSILWKLFFSVDFRSRKGGGGPRREYKEMACGPLKREKRR